MSTSNEVRATDILDNLVGIVDGVAEVLDSIAEKLQSEEAVQAVTSFLDGFTSAFTKEEEAPAPEPEPTTSNTYNTYTDPFAAFMDEKQFTDRLAELLNRPRARRDF